MAKECEHECHKHIAVICKLSTFYQWSHTIWPMTDNVHKKNDYLFVYSMVKSPSNYNGFTRWQIYGYISHSCAARKHTCANMFLSSHLVCVYVCEAKVIASFSSNESLIFPIIVIPFNIYIPLRFNWYCAKTNQTTATAEIYYWKYWEATGGQEFMELEKEERKRVRHMYKWCTCVCVCMFAFAYGTNE